MSWERKKYNIGQSWVDVNRDEEREKLWVGGRLEKLKSGCLTDTGRFSIIMGYWRWRSK